MGQRLVVDIRNDKECIATLYQHWSGYSTVALQSVATLMSNYAEILTANMKYGDRIFAVNLLSALCDTTSVINATDVDEYLKLAETSGLRADCAVDAMLSESDDRNSGIISISEAGINTALMNSEMPVSVDITDIDNPIFTHGAFWEIDDRSEILELVGSFDSAEIANMSEEELECNIKDQLDNILYLPENTDGMLALDNLENILDLLEMLYDEDSFFRRGDNLINFST